MPNLDELLNNAKLKTDKKKFSRGNRPDTILKGSVVSGQIETTPDELSLAENEQAPIKRSVEIGNPIKADSKVVSKSNHEMVIDVSKGHLKSSGQLSETRVLVKKDEAGLKMRELTVSKEKPQVSNSPVHKVEVSEHKTSISSRSIADNESTISRQLVDELSTIEKQTNIEVPIITQSTMDEDLQLSTTSRLMFETTKKKASDTDRLLVDYSSTSSLHDTSSVVNQQSTTIHSVAAELPINSPSVARPVADYSSAITQTDIISNTPIWTQLGPAQAAALIAIYQHCEIPTFKTTLMTKAYFVNSCNIGEKSVGSTIQKLVARGFISRLEGKGGVGGFMHFQVDPTTFHRLKRDGADSMLPSVVNPLPNQLSPPPSKLVSSINNNLLTPKQGEVEVPTFDVSEINVGSLMKFQISRKQIQDIKNQKLQFTNSTLQDFVDRFAIYASDPSNIRNVNSIPAIFVKMAQLASKGEDPLIDIETDTDRLIRERLERLKAKKEERLRQQTKLMELEFESWLEEIQTTGQDNLVPPTPIMKSGSIAQRMTLKTYFVENIWPQKAREFGFDAGQVGTLG